MIQKFRVFAKAGTETWFGGGYDRDQMFYEIRDIDYYDKTITVCGCHHEDCGTCDDTYNFDDVEILMSTGLKDKNGVEIYEGDVVEYFHTTAVIKRVKGVFAILNTKDYEYTTDLHGCMRVIGNIYEHGHLNGVI